MTDIDQKSQEILRALTCEGRISNTELADRVALSPSACLRRVQDLERRGVITGYRAIRGRDALGLGVLAYLGAMQAAPEVVECHNTTGTTEYLLRVECTDLQAYKVFHTDVLGTVAHVSSITTYMVLGSPKDERG